MASNVVVIGSDLKRATVKVVPGTFLVEVLEEASRKLNFSADKFTLKYRQKQLDLTIPFRAAGLSPGAKLELVARSSSPTVVSVALKLPPSEASAVPGGRLIDKYRSDTTLWKMLRAFESKDLGGGPGKKLNFTARGIPETQSGSGQLLYECPSINVMGRELSSVSDLQKTLSQIGVSGGSTLLQLSFRRTQQPLHEALQEITQYFEEVEGDQAKAEHPANQQASGQTESEAKGDQTQSTSTGDQDQAQLSNPPENAGQAEKEASTAAAETSTTAASSPPPPESTDAKAKAPQPTPSDQPTIYAAPTSSTPAAVNVVENESVYQPTVAHAQLHQERLKANAHNKRLLSDRELEEQASARRARMDAVRSVRVRARFPDGTAAQWDFGPEATGADLYRGVRSVMRRPELGFHLNLPLRPGASGAGRRETILDSAETPKHSLVRGYELEGAVLVNLIWEDAVPKDLRKQPFLREEAKGKAKDIPIPEVPQGEDESGDEKDKKGKGKAVGSSFLGGKQGRDGDGGGEKKKVPKWLKLGKK